MAATWKVLSMTVVPQESGYADVVNKVCWLASDTNGTYFAQVGGEIEIPLHTDHPWIEYSQLTEQDVLAWCYEDGLDKAAIEANLQEQILLQIADPPPVLELPLPWASN